MSSVANMALNTAVGVMTLKVTSGILSDSMKKGKGSSSKVKSYKFGKMKLWAVVNGFGKSDGLTEREPGIGLRLVLWQVIQQRIRLKNLEGI